MNKHTKGPWTLKDEGRFRRVIKSGEDKPRSVCIIERWTKEPDARLLVAAPTMFRQLKDILLVMKNIEFNEKRDLTLIQQIEETLESIIK